MIRKSRFEEKKSVKKFRERSSSADYARFREARKYSALSHSTTTLASPAGGPFLVAAVATKRHQSEHGEKESAKSRTGSLLGNISCSVQRCRARIKSHENRSHRRFASSITALILRAPFVRVSQKATRTINPMFRTLPDYFHPINSLS